MDIKIALKLAVCCQMTLEKKPNGSINQEKITDTLSKHYKDFLQVEPFVLDHIDGLLVKFKDYNVLVFKQSDDLKDWMTNLNMCTKAGFHKGFYNAADRVFKPAMMMVKGKPFYITGHSLGGAITTVLTYWLADHPGLLASYVYGSPKVVTTKHSKLYNGKTRGKLFRFSKYKDIFTFLPGFPNFKHVGKSFYIDKDHNLLPDISPSPMELLTLEVCKIYTHHHIDGYAAAVRKALLGIR